MFRNTDKAAYKIYKKIMYDAAYRTVLEEFTKSTNTLQKVSQTFSEDQWKAFKDYQNAFMNLHNTMMKIALRKKG